MSKQIRSAKPTSRRYSDAEKDQAVRLVRQLRKELGTDHGTVKRVADPVLVKGDETTFHAVCMSASRLGSLIHATWGSFGGVDGWWRNRAGLAW